MEMSLTANFPTGRRDYSMSPPRHDFYDDPRERNTRRQREMHRDRDGAHPRRDGGSRGTRHRDWDDEGRGGMYDDDFHRGWSEDDKRSDGHPRRRETRSHRSRSPQGGYRSRSWSRSPTREAGRPTDTVILEGLPFNISTSELRESLLSNSIAAEFPSIDVRISSSKGNCRAFVQFEEVDHAVAFVKEHFPQLLIHLPHSTDEIPDGQVDAYIHYARSREDADMRGPGGGNWVCPACDFSNYASRNKCKICGASPAVAPAPQHSLNGAADAADAPSQILVVHPLPPFVTEDVFASDMKRLELEKPDPSKETSKSGPKLKSTAPTSDASRYGARPGSLHRVFLMRDVKTDEPVKYGFVEFWTLEDAVAAMTKFRMSRSFTVATCAVTVSHIHLGVFIPEEREVTPAIEQMSFNPLFNPALRVKYRDPRAYPCQKLVTTDAPFGDDGRAKSLENEQNGDGKKATKKRKADGNIGGASTAKKSVSMAGHMAMWQRKHDEIHGNESNKDDSHDAATSAANPTPSSGGGSTHSFKSDPKAPIKISLSRSTMLATSSAASGAPSSSDKQSDSAPLASKDTTSEQAEQAEPVNDTDAAVSYVDRERLMCLICMRKYKSVDEVNIHEKSRNHKTAMENDELVKAALPRLAARDKRRIQKQAEDKGEAATTATSQYRDRAKERRQVYNQPKKPLAQADKPKPEASKPQQKSEPKPVQSKGAGMLAKMGWTTGSGLGANGDGRTDVIMTNAYQEGVGLGAEGGNLGDAADLAEKKTRNSYTDYLNTAQDKARERYNQMS